MKIDKVINLKFKTFFKDLLNAFPGGVVRVPQTSHRIDMKPQTLDVIIIQILKSTARECIKLKLKVNTSQLVTLRAYWGVDIPTFFHVLRYVYII